MSQGRDMLDVPYGELDVEIRPLVRLLNGISGIRTLFSCAGHGGEEDWIRAYVWFKADSLSALEALLFRVRVKPEWDMVQASCCMKLSLFEHKAHGMVFVLLVIAKGISRHRAFLANICHGFRD